MVVALFARETRDSDRSNFSRILVKLRASVQNEIPVRATVNEKNKKYFTRRRIVKTDTHRGSMEGIREREGGEGGQREGGKGKQTDNLVDRKRR